MLKYNYKLLDIRHILLIDLRNIVHKSHKEIRK